MLAQSCMRAEQSVLEFEDPLDAGRVPYFQVEP